MTISNTIKMSCAEVREIVAAVQGRRLEEVRAAIQHMAASESCGCGDRMRAFLQGHVQEVLMFLFVEAKAEQEENAEDGASSLLATLLDYLRR